MSNRRNNMKNDLNPCACKEERWGERVGDEEEEERRNM